MRSKEAIGKINSRDLGRGFQLLRESKGQTQTFAAAFCDKHTPLINKIEKGHKTIQLNTLEEILSHYDMTFCDFFQFVKENL